MRGPHDARMEAALLRTRRSAPCSGTTAGCAARHSRTPGATLCCPACCLPDNSASFSSSGICPPAAQQQGPCLRAACSWAHEPPVPDPSPLTKASPPLGPSLASSLSRQNLSPVPRWPATLEEGAPGLGRGGIWPLTGPASGKFKNKGTCSAPARTEAKLDGRRSTSAPDAEDTGRRHGQQSSQPHAVTPGHTGQASSHGLRAVEWGSPGPDAD